MARVARAILSLRNFHEATRMMELVAQACVFPTSPASRVMVVEPAAATKKGRKESAFLVPVGRIQQSSPRVLASPPLPIVPLIAEQPRRLRNSTRSTDALGIRFASRFQSFPSEAEKVASVGELTRRLNRPASAFRCDLLSALWQRGGGDDEKT